jgi:hypothetical protein
MGDTLQAERQDATLLTGTPPGGRKKGFGHSLINLVKGCYRYATEKTPISYGSLSFTYASIKNNGGLLVVSLGLGLTDNIVSVVIGGSLKPVEVTQTPVAQKKTLH